MKPQEDEFYAYDFEGTRVNGRFDGNGLFLVDPEERNVEGRCDSEGYLLDQYGNRVYSYQIKERLGKRRAYRQKRGNKPQPDELYSYTDEGVKVPGTYDKEGKFIVDSAYRSRIKVDEDGYLLSANGQRKVNRQIKERLKKRELQSKNEGTSNRRGGFGSRERRQKRSISRGSLEGHVDPSQMYEYFKEQSAGISKKAEGDRA